MLVSIQRALERLLVLPRSPTGLPHHDRHRSVGGLVSRDPLVGPWQVPVSDVAVTLASLRGNAGEAMALGERPPIALLDGPASGRMAVGEALTNIVAADVRHIGNVRLSANWMAACGQPGEDASLFDTVRAVGEELCPALGIAIPVGKDSLSMRTSWRPDGEELSVIAPVSLVITAFAPVADVRRTLTPVVATDAGITSLLLLDLGCGRDRLGGSSLAQVHGRVGRVPPDLDDPGLIRRFFAALRELADAGLVLAYHDRSDGGLAVTLLEMAFAGHAGLEVDLGTVREPLAALFSEELGAVIQLRDADLRAATAIIARHGLQDIVRRIGAVVAGRQIRIVAGPRTLIDDDRLRLHGRWSDTSWQMQRLRDDPDCPTRQAARLDEGVPACHGSRLRPDEDIAAPLVATGARQRSRSCASRSCQQRVEMAAACDRAGFAATDVHMTDLMQGRVGLSSFGARGLRRLPAMATCSAPKRGLGGRSCSERARALFADWFARGGNFTLGICNGCQMLAALRELIPGTANDAFRAQPLEQFEGRLSMVEVSASASPLFAGMAGSRMPIAVAPWRGRAGSATVIQEDGRADGAALRRQPRAGGDALSGESERLAAGDCRAVLGGRPGHDPDAAPGARLPQCAELMASAQMRRGQRLDAAVPQRARVARLSRVTAGRPAAA